MIEIKVKTTGPMFSRASDRAIERFVEDGERVLAEVGVQMARAKFGAKIRISTGHFLGRITKVNTGGRWRVWAQRIVYGRWLEGTGSRNRTTRFKGYHGFRDTQVIIDRDSDRILRPLMDKLVRELGGS